MKKIAFLVPCECTLPFSDEVRIYEDAGVLLLPDSYGEDKAPTRLVINCHGAGGTVTTDDSQVEGQVLTKYLLANGYAVMDVNGLPSDFADQYGIDIRNNIGSPIAMQTYIKAYHYCIDHFNLHKEIFVHGGSMGGISSTNLVLSEALPVLAQTGFCPVLDTYNEIFLHPWSDGLPKTAMGILYSFQKDAAGNYIYDEDKLLHYDPMSSKKVHPCPVLFCHCVNDPVVSFDITKKYVERTKEAGVEAELLALPDGLHEPQDYGAFIEKPSGISCYNGEVLNITKAIEAVFSWITCHENP